jgi:hypothetical protein
MVSKNYTGIENTKNDSYFQKEMPDTDDYLQPAFTDFSTKLFIH